jgi:hypothetical protein
VAGHGEDQRVRHGDSRRLGWREVDALTAEWLAIPVSRGTGFINPTTCLIRATEIIGSM